MAGFKNLSCADWYLLADVALGIMAACFVTMFDGFFLLDHPVLLCDVARPYGLDTICNIPP
jgi:hypothetical protein